MSETKLDDTTEEMLKEVCRAFNVIGLGRKEFQRQIEAQAALRQRIRTLVENAYSSGSFDALQRLTGRLP